MSTVSCPKSSLPISQHAHRAAEQAISFLMQQAVENADCISLAAGLVDEQTLPVELTKTCLTNLLSKQESGRRLLQYGTTPGPADLRDVMRGYLAQLEQCPNQLQQLSLDQLVMTTGSQQLLNLITQALFNPGDICLVPAPTYFVYLGVLQAAGAKIIPVTADKDGMCPIDLERQLNRIKDAGKLSRVRLVYVVSYYDNPTGNSVSAERRPQLLNLVQQFSEEQRILLLEDAAYRELQYSGEKLPSIWSFDTDHQTVILAQTFSKSFSPGVRVGFGVLPADLVKPVCDIKGNDDFGSAHLNQNLVGEAIRLGLYQHHVNAVRTGYKAKRDAMLDAATQYFSDIPGASWIQPDGGMYVWMTLPEQVATGFSSPLFKQATQVEKVMYVPGELGYPADMPNRPCNQMRLSYGVQSVDGIREGMRRLASAVKTVLAEI